MSNYPLEWGADADSSATDDSPAADPPASASRYPLEWGWHVPPDPPATPDNTKLWPTLLGVGDNDAILAASTPPSVIKTSAPVGKANSTGAIAAAPEGALPSLEEIGSGAAAIAKRAAPYVLRIAGAASSAGSILLTPGNTQESYVDLGDGLRARIAPGEVFPKIQRRAAPGVFGSDFGARWEEAPVEAHHGSDAEGRRVVVIHRGQLEDAIGAERAAEVARLPGVIMAGPPEDEKEQAEESTQEQQNTEQNLNEPPLPDGLVGVQDDKATSREGRHLSGPLHPDRGGSGDAKKDFDLLTGGKSKAAGERHPPGTLIGPNGIRLRPGVPGRGPRIEIPSQGAKPHETLHYPESSP